LIFYIAAIFANNKKQLFLYNIFQAYIQLIIKLNCDFFILAFIKLIIQLGIIKDSIFKIVKLLYSISKADNYWFKIYYIYYFNKLDISQSIYNLYLLYRNKLFEIIGLQTDNILFVENAEFTNKKQNNLKKAQFLAKNRD